MSSLKGKIDFVMVVSATNANPNGDPLNGNRPRENYEGYGEISDVCIKRKLRNRFQDLGEKVFVQSDDRSDDGFTSLKDRADGCEELAAEIKKGNAPIKKPVRKLHVKSGWTLEHLDRYLPLREMMFRSVSAGRYQYIRRSAVLRWISSAHKSQKA